MRASQRRACGSVPELSCRRDRNRDSVVLSRHTDHGMRPPAPTLMQHALALARSLVRSFVCSFVRSLTHSFSRALRSLKCIRNASTFVFCASRIIRVVSRIIRIVSARIFSSRYYNRDSREYLSIIYRMRGINKRQ